MFSWLRSIKANRKLKSSCVGFFFDFLNHLDCNSLCGVALQESTFCMCVHRHLHTPHNFCAPIPLDFCKRTIFSVLYSVAISRKNNNISVSQLGKICQWCYSPLHTFFFFSPLYANACAQHAEMCINSWSSDMPPRRWGGQTWIWGGSFLPAVPALPV